MPTGLEHSKYFTVEDIEKAWEGYKQKCENHFVEEVSAGKVLSVNRPRIPTVGEFCHKWLNVTEQTLLNYENAKGYEAYFETIKKIKDEVAQFKKAALINAQGSTTGLIFDLKVNYGWTEKQVIEQNVTYKANLGDTIILTPPEAGGNTSST